MLSINKLIRKSQKRSQISFSNCILIITHESVPPALWSYMCVESSISRMPLSHIWLQSPIRTSHRQIAIQQRPTYSCRTLSSFKLNSITWWMDAYHLLRALFCSENVHWRPLFAAPFISITLSVTIWPVCDAENKIYSHRNNGIYYLCIAGN